MSALALMLILSCGTSGWRADDASARARSREQGFASLTIVVAAAPDISAEMTRGAVSEATAIWSAAGVALTWRASEEPASQGLGSGGPAQASESSHVQIILDDARGTAFTRDLSLGWITFNAAGAPEPLVHLSRRNAVQLVDTAPLYRNLPARFKDVLVARALGRALAHELGHYLMASKDHTASGLMKGRRLSDEMFSPARNGFQLNGDERLVAANGLATAAGVCGDGPTPTRPPTSP